MQINENPKPTRYRPFKNEKIEYYAKKIDKAAIFMLKPRIMKMSLNDFIFFGSAAILGLTSGCEQAKEEKQPVPAQLEQKTNQVPTQVPTIRIVDNRLFVGDKEMLAKDFVEKYCFASKDNQACIEAVVLARQQNRKMPPQLPTNW